MKNPSMRGFTLIELMIVLAVVAILTMLAMPDYVEWLQNSKTRTVAEGIQNGLRFAQQESARLSRLTTFTATATGWKVEYVPVNAAADALVLPANPLQVSPAGGLEGAVVAIGSPAATVVRFNSLGRVFGAPTATSTFTPLSVDAKFDVSNPRGSRKLQVRVSQAGKIRMCDPDTAFNVATTPQGCPP